MFRKRNKKKHSKKSTENRYPPRVQETTEPGSGNVLYFA